jgi:hypothetical protein
MSLDGISRSIDPDSGRLSIGALFGNEDKRKQFDEARDFNKREKVARLEAIEMAVEEAKDAKARRPIDEVKDLLGMGAAASAAGPEAANSVGERIAAIFSSRAAADVLPRVDVSEQGITAKPGQRVGGVFQRTKDIVQAGETARDTAGIGRKQLAQKQAATDELAAQSGSPAQAKFASETQLGGNAVSRAQSQEDQRRQITVDRAQSAEIQRRTFAIDAHEEAKAARRSAQSRAALEAMLPQSGAIPEEQRGAIEWALSVLPSDSPLNTAIFERVLEGNLRRVPETQLTGTATTSTQSTLQLKSVDLIEAQAQIRVADTLLRTPEGELDDSMFGLGASVEEGGSNLLDFLGVDTGANERLQRYRMAETNLDASAQTYARSESGLQLPEEQYTRLRKNWPSVKGGKYRYAAKMEVIDAMLTRKLNLSSRLASGQVTLEQANTEFRAQVDELISQLMEANDRALIQEARDKGVDVNALLNEEEDAE